MRRIALFLATIALAVTGVGLATQAGPAAGQGVPSADGMTWGQAPQDPAPGTLDDGMTWG
ncbi:hypothetical protein [Longispora albida]|uniref:hypothetical protein n=1 Tax=Longispora albida TaxID=203523 RepID=UPI0003705BBB|nr:hypothetical protein [Longispora albida]